MTVDLLVRGRHVIASAEGPDGAVIADGAVAVAGDEIVAVDTYDTLRRHYPQAQTIGSGDHLVIPGLVNSHHHGWGLSAFALGARDDLLEPWLIDLACLPHVDVYHDTLYAATKLLRSGVTCVQHSGFSRDFGALRRETTEALRAYETAGLRVGYAVQIRDRHSYAYEDDQAFLRRVPPELAAEVNAAADAMGATSFDEFEDLARELVTKYADHPRIHMLLSAEGPEWCSDDVLLRIRALADELAVGVHLHCLESPYQREMLNRTYGRPVMAHLDKLGFLRDDVSIAHAVWLTEDDMRLCATRGVSVCHNPSSNLRLRVGIAPVSTMLEHGVNVAIGIDSSGINDDDDMLQEIGLAARLHTLPRGLESTAPPKPLDILRMATIDGARAIGLADEIGVLEAGRRADLTVLDYKAMSGPYMSDTVDPIDVLIYRGRSRHVDSVVVHGRPILVDNAFISIDESAVHQRIAESARTPPTERIAAWIDAVRQLRPYVAEYYRNWLEPPLQPSYVPNSLS